MKKTLLLGIVLAFLCPGCIMQSNTASPQAAPEGFVKLAITGTGVNLRPVPQASGTVVTQANMGDIFIAEQWPIENTAEKSQWYRIVFAVKADGSIAPLPSADKRFKAGVFPFVSAKFATTSPLTSEEDVAARKIPYRKGYQHGLGSSLPEIIRAFGPGEVKREFNPEELQYFGIGNVLFAQLNLAGLPDSFLWETLDGPYQIYGKSFTLTKPGAVYDGVAIATPGFGKEEVRKLMKAKWKDMEPKISIQETGEHWSYNAEMWDCEFSFDEQGLVKSYHYYFTTG